jgi:hypothetical protein
MKLFKAALLGAILCPGVAFGAACSGPSPFTDVGAASGFCSNVEWLKNRSITLGANCPPAAAPSYCPNDFVNRLQMAAFMNRLADAVLPAPTSIEAVTPAMTLTPYVDDNPQCVSSPFAAANYPRIFVLSTRFSAKSSSGTVTVGAQPLYSIDGGATWYIPNSYVERAGLDATRTGQVTSDAALFAPAGATITVAEGLNCANQAGGVCIGNTGIAANGACHIVVRQHSFTDNSSPYDAARSGLAEGQRP